MLTSSRSLAISCLLLALALSLPAVPLCAQTNVAPGAAPVQQGTGMPKVPAVPPLPISSVPAVIVVMPA